MTAPAPTRASTRVRSTGPWLLVGGVVSLAMHALVGSMMITAASQPSGELANITPAMDELPTLPPRPRLGLEQSNQASINWLGFADPTEHATPELFETDQAALTRDLASSIEPTPQANPTPAAETGQARDMTAQAAQPETQAEPESIETTPPAAPPPLPRNELAVDDATDPEVTLPLEQPEESPDEARERRPDPSENPAELVTVEPLDESESQPEQNPSEATKAEGEAEAESDTGVGAPVQPAVPASTPDPADPNATPSDRDSSATSREVSLTLDRLGRPAAGEGLEIKTVRLDSREKSARLLAGALRNPVFEIEFERQAEGPAKVARAEFAKEKQPTGGTVTRSTGNDQIDRILRLNVYRWTATGKAIDEIEVGKAVSIRLTLVLR